MNDKLAPLVVAARIVRKEQLGDIVAHLSRPSQHFVLVDSPSDGHGRVPSTAREESLDVNFLVGSNRHLGRGQADDKASRDCQKVGLDGERDGVVLSNVAVEKTRGCIGLCRPGKRVSMLVNLGKNDAVFVDVLDDLHVGKTSARASAAVRSP